MPTTEVATYALPPGSDVNDPANYAAKSSKALFDVVAQQPGAMKHHLGMAVDRAAKGQPVIEAMIGWTSIDAHTAWRASPLHAQVREADVQANADALAAGLVTPLDPSVAAGIARMFHVSFEPYSDVARACGAPVTEVATLHFDGDVPEEGWIALLHALRAFREVVLAHIRALDAEEGGSGLFEPSFALGLSHEVLEFELDPPPSSPSLALSDATAKRLGKGRAALFLVSWPSIAAHLSTAALPSYLSGWEALRATMTKAGLVLGRVEVHHTIFGYGRGLLLEKPIKV